MKYILLSSALGFILGFLIMQSVRASTSVCQNINGNQYCQTYNDDGTSESQVILNNNRYSGTEETTGTEDSNNDY